MSGAGFDLVVGRGLRESPFDDDLVAVGIGFEGVFAGVGQHDRHFPKTFAGFDETLDRRATRCVSEGLDWIAK